MCSSDLTGAPDDTGAAQDAVDNDAGSAPDLGACPSVPNDLPEGALIISEVMLHPAAASDPDAEWFEIYNTTSSPIPLNNLLITDAIDFDQHSVAACKLIVPAKGVVVLAKSADPAVNGGVKADYVYGDDIKLDNKKDTIKLVVGGTTEIDVVK